MVSKVKNLTLDPGPNQLDRRLLGTAGLNPFPGTVSASRQQMFSSHIGQNITILHPSRKSIQTGMEYEYGKYTFNISMPENGRIIQTFDRYPYSYGKDSFILNPERVVLYEGESGKIGMIQVGGYCSNHPYFGFEFKPTKDASKLVAGNHISKDTVFFDSPNKQANGEYHYARELNMAYMTHPSTSDDGIVISKDVLGHLAFRVYERRVVSWGKDAYPLNLYGDDDNYKIFPDIGEYVHPEGQHKGLLMALRDYDPGMLLTDMSKASLRVIDDYFDKATYVAGEGGRVVDIKIYHQPPVKGESLCDEMMQQAIRYRDADLKFRRNILDEYERLKKQRGGKLQITPELHRYLIECMAILNVPVNKLPDTLRKVHKLTPMDEWRAEFVIEYVLTPTIGSKLTDLYGGKGVITAIVEPEEMPVAANGLRADIVMDPGSNSNRMKYASLYEQYLNGLKFDLRQRFCQTLGIEQPEIADQYIYQCDNEKIDEVLNQLSLYHSIVSPRQHKWMMGLTRDQQVKYLINCLKEGIVDYIPSENEPDLPTMIKTLDELFKPVYGPVTFQNKDGKLITTELPVRIGGVYMMLLEKMGMEWSSVAVSKTQQNGVITYVNGKDKYATPTKRQATRVFGEAEMRILAAYVGGDFAVDMHDQSNNPNARRLIANSILSADKPTQIENTIDREVVPLGYSQPHQIMNHILQCIGYKLTYGPYDSSKQRPKQAELETQ